MDSYQVVHLIATPIGLLASSLLLAWPFFFRSPRHPFFIVLANWALAHIFDLTVKATVTFTSSKTWMLGRFWCHMSSYLLPSLSFTRPYLIVLAALLTLVGNQRFNRWTGPRTWVKILAPCLACLSVWLLTLLPGIWYWYRAELLTGSRGLNKEASQVCIGSALPALVYLFVMFLVPIMQTMAFLLGWACLQRRANTADPVEKIQAFILFVVLHVYILTQFLSFAAHLIDLSSTSFAIELITAFNFLSIAGYALSPTLCLVIIVVYRQTLLNSKATNDASGENIGGNGTNK